MQRKSTRKASTNKVPEDKDDTVIAEEGTRSIREIKDAVFADL